jgi:hypothetical protein
MDPVHSPWTPCILALMLYQGEGVLLLLGHEMEPCTAPICDHHNYKQLLCLCMSLKQTTILS